MNLTDELERLGRLHKEGVLTNEEFAQAKQKLLSSQPGPVESPEPDRTLGEAANRYVSFQMVMAVIGIIIMLIFLFGFILPHMQDRRSFEIRFPR